MIPKRFDYYALASFDEAIRLLGENEEAKVLAGGQSLLPMMKLRLAAPTALVDITKLPDLSYVRDEGDHLAIGALTTHDAIEHDRTIKERFTAINDAVVRIGDQQIRNRGTIVSLTFRISSSMPPISSYVTCGIPLELGPSREDEDRWRRRRCS
jgi:aerobic carbon-monoxide dehydrogenase medium subunit